MKKALYLLLFASLVACTVEPIPAEQEENTTPVVEQSGIESLPTQLTASMQEEITKTSYSDTGAFTWLSSDQVRLLIYRNNAGDNDQYTWKVLNYVTYGSPTLSSDNKIATFGTMLNTDKNGLDNGSDKWLSTGYAVYPTEIAGSASGNTTGCALVILKNTPEGTLNKTPLIGKRETDALGAGQDAFIFHNATGVMALTLNNIPASAQKLEIASSGTYKICGVFKLDNTDEIPQIKTGMCINDYGNKVTLDISSISGSHTFYIPMPVGEVPAQTLSIAIYETDSVSGLDVTLMKKTVKPALNIKRSELLAFPALDASSEWTKLGTGKFMDTNLWQIGGLNAAYVNTTIYQNVADPNHFKAIYPYGNAVAQLGYASTADYKTPADNEFHFYQGMYASNDKVVLYDPHATGMHYVGASSYALDAHMFSGYRIANYTGELSYSKIISSQSSGLPAEIQLAPCYRDSYYATTWMNGGSSFIFEKGKDHEDGVVDIVFPSVNPVHFPKSIDLPRIALTSAMLTPSCSEGSEGSTNGLVDRIWNNGTGKQFYWHSPYNSAATNNTEFGIYIDIDLGDNTLQNFALAFCLRDVWYNHPKHVKIYGSTDGTWDSSAPIADVADVMSGINKGEWIEPITCTGTAAYKYIRIAILSNSGDEDLTAANTYSCTHMAELELYGVYGQ